MTFQVVQYPIRDVYQNGKLKFRPLSQTTNTNLRTTTQRDFAWRSLFAKDKKDSSIIILRVNESLKEVPRKNESVAVSEIIHRDELSRSNPWKSVTHKEFYEKLEEKSQDFKFERAKGEITASKTKAVEELISCVTHAPEVRMICQDRNNLISTYSRHYKAPDCITEPYLLEKDVDFSRPVQPLTVPYSSKSWKTSYNLDYGLRTEVKSVRKSSFPEIPSVIEYSDPLYKSEWTTSYEDYGQKRDLAINTVPLTEHCEKSEASNMVLLPNTEVGRLLKY